MIIIEKLWSVNCIKWERVLRDLGCNDYNISHLHNSNIIELLQQADKYRDQYCVEFRLDMVDRAYILKWDRKRKMPLTLEYSEVWKNKSQQEHFVKMNTPIDIISKGGNEIVLEVEQPDQNEKYLVKDELSEIETIEEELGPESEQVKFTDQEETAPLPKHISNKRDYGEYNKKGY